MAMRRQKPTLTFIEVLRCQTMLTGQTARIKSVIAPTAMVCQLLYYQYLEGG